jgi:hypothetical protein
MRALKSKVLCKRTTRYSLHNTNTRVRLYVRVMNDEPKGIF